MKIVIFPLNQVFLGNSGGGGGGGGGGGCGGGNQPNHNFGGQDFLVSALSYPPLHIHRYCDFDATGANSTLCCYCSSGGDAIGAGDAAPADHNSHLLVLILY